MYRRRLAVAALMVALAGCGSLLYRTTHLRSFDQRLAHAYGVHEVILQTVPGAVTVGHLSATNGDYVLRMAAEARTVLDHARALDIAGHGVEADQSLRLGWGIMTELDAFLKSQRPRGFLKEYEEWKEVSSTP